MKSRNCAGELDKKRLFVLTKWCLDILSQNYVVLVRLYHILEVATSRCHAATRSTLRRDVSLQKQVISKK